MMADGGSVLGGWGLVVGDDEGVGAVQTGWWNTDGETFPGTFDPAAVTPVCPPQ